MSKLYAVSYMDFFNNNLITEIHQANCWQDALMMHSNVVQCGEFEATIMTQDIEDAKEDAFNGDWLFDVVEVPSNAA